MQPYVPPQRPSAPPDLGPPLPEELPWSATEPPQTAEELRELAASAALAREAARQSLAGSPWRVPPEPALPPPPAAAGPAASPRPEAAPPAAQELPAAGAPAPEAAVRDAPADSRTDFADASFGASGFDTSTWRDGQEAGYAIDEAVPPPEPADTAPEDLGFIRDARRKAFWRRPLVRVLVALLVLAGIALLAAQAALHWRDRLAALRPELRPWLEAACEPLGCQLGPPKQIEAIVIDSSTFNRLRSDAYRLSFTVRNTSAFAVAAPAMELTLTDTQDQPVLRRVLQPAEAGAPGPVLAPASEWAGSVSFTVPAGGALGGRIAGYRLLAFYP
jgi:hypothetical protein